MTSRIPRRGTVTRASIALAAAAIGVGFIATPAQAETAPYYLDAYSYPWEGENFLVGWSAETERQRAGFHIDLGTDGDEVEDEDVHVVFGLSDDLGGLTFETEAPGCLAEGATITCDFVGISTWANELSVEFDVLVPPSVNAYDQTEYMISVQPGEYDASEFFGTWQFDPIGDVEAEYDSYASSFDDVQPGSSVTPEIAFKNAGDLTFNGVYLSFWNDVPYLDVAAEYSNCGVTDWDEVMCVFSDLAPEPGVVYELSADSPLVVTLDEKAPGPIIYRNWFTVHAIDSWTQLDIDELEFADSDKELRFELSDLDDIEDSPMMAIKSASNPYDVSVSDSNVDAAAGETAAFEITIENPGPADADARDHPGSGEGSYTLAFQLPSGVELGGVDEYGYSEIDGYYCTDITKMEWASNLDPAKYQVERIDVLCRGPEVIEAGETFVFELPVEITADAPATDGIVAVLEGPETWDYTDFDEYWELSEDDYPMIDSDFTNNTAVLTLNVAGSGSGKLPDTGVSLTVIVGAAGAALAAGAMMFVVLRRRKTAAEW